MEQKWLLLCTFPAFLYAPRNFAFLSITTSKALTFVTTAGAAFGSQVLLRLCCPRLVLMWQRMLTQPIAAASPPGDTSTGTGRGGAGQESTSSSVLQILMHRINSCGVWVTEQRYPCVGSYSMYPAVNTNQLAELEGQVGSSSALVPLSPHLCKGIPQVLAWQYLEGYQQLQ